MKEQSEQEELVLNVKKTKIMSTDSCREEAFINIIIDRDEIERVRSFEYPGSRIQANGETTPEIRRKIGNGNNKTK